MVGPSELLQISYWSLTGLAVLCVFAYPIGLTIYRLFFSPLSKLPGPWLTRISSIPEVNALKEQRRTKWVNSLFEQNPGAVAVRTGPTSVSFNHPDAVKAIYGTSTSVPTSASELTIRTPRSRQECRRIRQVELV